jgi:hypothetical protein
LPVLLPAKYFLCQGLGKITFLAFTAKIDVFLADLPRLRPASHFVNIGGQAPHKLSSKRGRSNRGSSSKRQQQSDERFLQER